MYIYINNCYEFITKLINHNLILFEILYKIFICIIVELANYDIIYRPIETKM